MARSVRDVCRWYDVAAGYDGRDPYSLPKIDGWERDLGSFDLAGKKVAILPDLSGKAWVRSEVKDLVAEVGELLAKATGLEVVDGPRFEGPPLGVEWAFSNLATLKAELMDLWPACSDDLTTEIAFGLRLAEEHYTLELAARSEMSRTKANEAMADLFDQVDFVFCATNPDVAFPAETTLVMEVAGQPVGPDNAGALTIPANNVGNPSCSVPIGTLPSHDGASPALPVGMQIMGRHHADQLVLDLALALERERPWPLVAPGTPV
jgi:aspartyl-tRNA(Asn)/glutamyl-tRNA(Gln) amidotransferase subunit A